MADDLDDELFSLAAGRSKPAAKKRSRKPAESDDEDARDLSEEDEARKRKKPAKGSSKRAKHASEDEGDDDGYDNGGGDDDLYMNDEDRRRLMAMTELEREMILAERAEQRDKERQRKDLLKQQRLATEKAEGRGKRMRSGTSDKDNALRAIEAARERQGKGKSERSGRNRSGRGAAARASRDWSEDDGSDGDKASDEGEDEDEEEEYVASGSEEGSESEEAGAGRRSGGEEEEEQEEEPAPRATPSGRAPTRAAAAEEARERGGAVAHDAGGRSGLQEGEEDEEDLRSAHQRERERERAALGRDEDEAEEATLEELLACQVKREQLEQWAEQPFFSGDALNGCVVRMAYGPNMRDQQGNTHPGYMIMEIIDIKEASRSYPFGSRQERTHKHLVLRDGAGITRVMAMANISNKPFSEAEYERYKRHCGRANRDPITKEEAAEAKMRVQMATNYRWTAADVKADLERKRANRTAPVNPAAEKAALKRRLHMAMSAGNTDEASVLEEQLGALEMQLLTQGQNQRTFGMMDLNKRNKQFNLTVAYKTTAAEEHGTVGDGTGGSDVFSRRETKLNIYWKTKSGPDADQGNQQEAAAHAAAAQAKAQASVPDKLSRAQRRMDPVDLIRNLGLDINVDLVRGSDQLPPLQARVLGSKWLPAVTRTYAAMDLSGKSVLSLTDWKRRAGEY